MKSTLQDRLLKRELGDTSRYSKIRGVYGDSQFVNKLDIVNELNGHDGCVNALSWSRSGSLLASGSDDTRVNIYSYHPDNSEKQFDLTTSIDTGHTQNIFSVKFMPHSNDRTIVSAAGDSQIRIFDIENATSSSGPRRFSNAKVFRSHSSAVKRIVTEASPFYFLSCAEDGDVRQWDIRQPESAYPRSVTYFPSHHRTRGARDDAPPPLISYKKYNIDLYTISCSPSQPHYIALGGSHLHCFLHDRRMLGRDKLQERGGLLDASIHTNDSALEAATRCVRKFAPYGQPKMSRNDHKTITACKISDANPNELIASWHSDFIYSFNIHEEEGYLQPKAHDGFTEGTSNGRIKFSGDGKRKRPREGSLGISREGETRASSHRRTESTESANRQADLGLSILVRMDNGESVEYPMPNGTVQRAEQSQSEAQSATKSDTSIGKDVVELRKVTFTAARHHVANPSSEPPDDEKVDMRIRMERPMVLAQRLLDKIDNIMHNWSYPVTESSGAIAFQRKLRDDRGSTWRFVQACGTIARVASRWRADAGNRRMLDYFDIIRPAPREPGLRLDRHEQFGYDFIKTILLWLDSGVGAVLRELTCDPDNPSSSHPRRRPIPKGADIDAIDSELIPYLENLASDTPIVDVDETGNSIPPLFRTERDAVKALSDAMKIPFADLTGETADYTTEGLATSQDRDHAAFFWAYRVCRAVLRNASFEVNFALVDTAFGEFAATPEDIVTGRRDDVANECRTPAPFSEGISESDIAMDTEQVPEEAEYADDSSTSDESTLQTDHDDDDEDDSSNADYRTHFLAGPQPRSKLLAGKGVPSSTHTRSYRGHCNVETTKDVNFFGLQDEYVVSGSDCGNLFIWDRKSSRLLNILEGDNEVVNVIQGHPYEPMIAVSGIDHTVKIFSPDGRARRDAKLGKGMEKSDHSTFSSIGLRHRRRGESMDTTTTTQEALERTAELQKRSIVDSDDDSEEEPFTSLREQQENEGEVTNANAAGYHWRPTATDSRPSHDPRARQRGESHDFLASRKRMQDEYEITARNDSDRRRGGRSESSFLTRGMMAMLARRFRDQMSDVGVDLEELLEGEEGREALEQEGCVVM